MNNILSINELFLLDQLSVPRLQSDASYVEIIENGNLFHGLSKYTNNEQLFFNDNFQKTAYIFIGIDQKTNIRSIYLRTDNYDIIKKLINRKYLESHITRNQYGKSLNVRHVRSYGICQAMFCSNVFLYTNLVFDENQIIEINNIGLQEKLDIAIFDREYTKEHFNKLQISAFMSYSYKDKNIAEEIVKNLYQRSCNIWFDKTEILPGDNIYDKIDTGIKQCSTALILLSESYINNHSFAKIEFDSIRNKGKFIPICYNLDHNKIPLQLKHISYVKYDEHNKEESLQQIYRAILNHNLQTNEVK